MPPTTDSAADSPPRRRVHHDPDGLTVMERVATLAAIMLPFVGLVVGIVQVWGWGIGWLDLGLSGNRRSDGRGRTRKGREVAGRARRCVCRSPG